MHSFLFFSIVFGGIVLDQATKAIAPGIINYGMVWGAFAAHPLPLWMWVLATSIITYALLRYMLCASTLGKYGAALSIAGSMSNMIDRIYYGGVVDIITLRTTLFTWPSFNVADVGIVLGVLCMIFALFREHPHSRI